MTLIRAVNVVLLSALALWLLWPEPAPDKRILFVGNSFTFGGNVPEQVRRIAASAEPPVRYEVEMIAVGGHALVDHVADGDAEERIAAEDWDAVILQDFSTASFTSHGRRFQKEGVLALSKLVPVPETDLYYFAHWPPETIEHPTLSKTEAVRQIERTYGHLASQTGAKVIPVGAAWLKAWEKGQTDLYSPDQHHSSVKGAYIAALAIAQQLGDVAVETSDWAPKAVSDSEAEQLRAAVVASEPALASVSN